MRQGFLQTALVVSSFHVLEQTAADGVVERSVRILYGEGDRFGCWLDVAAEAIVWHELSQEEVLPSNEPASMAESLPHHNGEVRCLPHLATGLLGTHGELATCRRVSESLATHEGPWVNGNLVHPSKGSRTIAPPTSTGAHDLCRLVWLPLLMQHWSRQRPT